MYKRATLVVHLTNFSFEIFLSISHTSDLSILRNCNGNWSFTFSDFQDGCEYERQLSNSRSIHNGYFKIVKSSKHSCVIEYRCVSGYTLDGESRLTRKLVMKKNGGVNEEWSHLKPNCKGIVLSFFCHCSDLMYTYTNLLKTSQL